jgi:hypothetical protein
MTTHLTEKAMTDVLEGGGSPVEWAHVASCRECRSRIEEARRGLDLAARTEVPEPPGMYWEALRRNVGRRISEESARPAWRGWLAPLVATAAALAIVVVVIANRPEAPAVSTQAVPAWSALPPVEEDAGLAVLTGLAAAEDGTELTDWEEGQGLGAFVASLSEEESEALVAALRVERPEGEL